MVLTIFLSLLLVTAASAKYESLIIGPYNISFDLNTTRNYSLSNATKQSETYCGAKYDTYTIILSNKSNSALITIADFKNKIDKGINNIQSNFEDYLRGLNYYNNIVTYNRTIDNQSGVISVGLNSNGDPMFAAQYWAKRNSSSIKKPNASSETNVLIMSNYPWDDGTLNLLKTIHVENDL
jgi:hypothetical protein